MNGVGHTKRGVGFNKDPWSAATHFVGLVAALMALPYLIFSSTGDVPKLIGMAVYGLTLAGIFASSTAYHFFDLGPRGNGWLQRVDHAAIYLFIAGSFLPVCLHLLDGPWRLAMLAGVCTTALLGAGFKIVWFDCPVWISTALYLGLAWGMAIVPGHLMVPQMSAWELGWLATGGLVYTVGALIFTIEWPDPLESFGHHEVWHLAVMLGAGAHFIFITGFLDAPRPAF